MQGVKQFLQVIPIKPGKAESVTEAQLKPKPTIHTSNKFSPLSNTAANNPAPVIGSSNCLNWILEAALANEHLGLLGGGIFLKKLSNFRTRHTDNQSDNFFFFFGDARANLCSISVARDD